MPLGRRVRATTSRTRSRGLRRRKRHGGEDRERRTTAGSMHGSRRDVAGWLVQTSGARRATRGASRHGRTRTREDQCLSSTFFGFGGDGTFAYWNAGVAFSASFVAPGR